MERATAEEGQTKNRTRNPKWYIDVPPRAREVWQPSGLPSSETREEPTVERQRFYGTVGPFSHRNIQRMWKAISRLEPTLGDANGTFAVDANEVPITYPPQPHAEQQANEGEECQGLAEHGCRDCNPIGQFVRFKQAGKNRARLYDACRRLYSSAS